ncbi:MAG: zinc ribbon domain-containing protein [Christensenellales bacterium]|jgi:hypothetical protein
MFFIGVFGVNDKEKEIKRFDPSACPCCGRLSSCTLIESFRCFHIYFLPLFKWKKRYTLAFGCCGCAYEADPDYAAELKYSDSVDISRLKKLEYTSKSGVCQSCGRQSEGNYAYCPYCGNRL